MEDIKINDVINEIRTAREDDYVLIKLDMCLLNDNDYKLSKKIIVAMKNVVVIPNNDDNNMIAIELIFNNKNEDFDIINHVYQEYLFYRDGMIDKFILELIERVNKDYGISMEVQFIDAYNDGKTILFTGYLSGNCIYYGEKYEVDKNNCNKKKKSSSDDINDIGPELTRDFPDVGQNKSFEEETVNEKERNEKESEEELKIKQYNDEQMEQFHKVVVETIRQKEIAKKRKRRWER